MDYKKWNKEKMGRRIATCRMNAELSQRDLAGLMGIKQSEIGYYETGKRTPDDKRLTMLADILKVDKNWLMYGEVGNYELIPTDYGKEVIIHFVDNKKNKETEKESMKLYKKLSIKDQSLVHTLINALYLDSNPDLLKKSINEELENFKKESKKRKYRLNVEITKRLDALKKVYPDLWEQLIEAYKSSGNGKVYMETQDRIFQEAQIRTWKNHPDLYKQYKENIIPNPKNADEEKFNKMYIGTKIVPELIRRETNRQKKSKRKNE